ncbi:hypothetical protein GOODEAATRI_032315 [Goodea atripinnis]|uniref:Uncharacterized protein n=1 Tax=Goodea atripinnis TaxID=208336 RepID=A0ABV0PTH7_9TELE
MHMDVSWERLFHFHLNPPAQAGLPFPHIPPALKFGAMLWKFWQRSASHVHYSVFTVFCVRVSIRPFLHLHCLPAHKHTFSFNFAFVRVCLTLQPGRDQL